MGMVNCHRHLLRRCRQPSARRYLPARGFTSSSTLFLAGILPASILWSRSKPKEWAMSFGNTTGGLSSLISRLRLHISHRHWLLFYYPLPQSAGFLPSNCKTEWMAPRWRLSQLKLIRVMHPAPWLLIFVRSSPLWKLVGTSRAQCHLTFPREFVFIHPIRIG